MADEEMLHETVLLEEVLHGGVANAGAVVRVGNHVLRPSNPHSASIHRYLAALHRSGFAGASVPVGIDDDGRERLRFVPGDVAIPPYPDWVQADSALGSVARLMRSLHDASVGLDLGEVTWSDEMADLQAGTTRADTTSTMTSGTTSGTVSGTVMCHNDVCVENVVFRHGEAVAFLDFDFAAPGRREFDVAAFARMCVPIDDDTNAGRLGWKAADRPARLRLICDEYGLDRTGRAAVLDCLSDSIARGGEFVRRRVEAGEAAFVEMWESMGGQERFDRRRRWWSTERDRFARALR